MRRLREGKRVGWLHLLRTSGSKGREANHLTIRMSINYLVDSVRKVKQNQSFKVRVSGGDRTKLEKEIQFLKSMVFCKNQALLHKQHCEKTGIHF